MPPLPTETIWTIPEIVADQPPPLRTSNQEPFSLQVFDIYTLAPTATISFGSALTHAEALGTIPEFPSLAISLMTLELMCSIKLVKSSFSVESFTRLLSQF